MSVNQVRENGVHDVKVLPAFNDKHGGVIVEMKEPMDPESFVALLRDSIALWRLQGKKGAWIKLPIGLANLVETAVKAGFWYHHAEPDYLMLVCWIPATTNTIPANATHRVGVGAIVLNDKREMLVVQEKSGVFQGTGVWKIPTGVVDEGEDIFMAAVREVKEETGVSETCVSIFFVHTSIHSSVSLFLRPLFPIIQVDTEFLEILAFRQLHKSFFGKSDLFFLCMMRPLSFNIQKQELEIEAAQWMPFEEYATQPFTQKHEHFRYIGNICLKKMEDSYTGFCPQPIKSSFTDELSYLYFNSRDLNNSNSVDSS
ncbi:nudix hydrolase 2-like isoform X1 [Carica papaya]|uniref:nudix hydrolase 2-like isoform X1 n=1 Tax=Carica papaya TaxID=3649 RepID=UPI000B8CF1C1|nr:nudix hydrolase 2-like isoform X1 [Carica papaya]XP_021905899.1 nudix hydrolase 2-like isoform X1 [Carica papaya]XP_021905900.1 nudix hydrolase 2-like isoform X1 [Carica papaya]XP_021905901.1 nudix hydrolase 2-like isoform X1 [Carica papaya]